MPTKSRFARDFEEQTLYRFTTRCIDYENRFIIDLNQEVVSRIARNIRGKVCCKFKGWDFLNIYEICLQT